MRPTITSKRGDRDAALQVLTFSVWSQDADNTRFPSASTATPWTELEWPSRVRSEAAYVGHGTIPTTFPRDQTCRRGRPRLLARGGGWRLPRRRFRIQPANLSRVAQRSPPPPVDPGLRVWQLDLPPPWPDLLDQL